MGQRSRTETVAAVMAAFLTRRTWPQAELARAVGVRPETIRKLLEELSASGVPLESEKEHPHVYWSMPKTWYPGGILFKQDDVPELLRQLRHLPRGKSRDRLLAVVAEQNRGDYIDGRALPQFKPLSAWLAPREEALREALGDGLILFGEWCFARHTVAYDALPDWFLAFDVYDRAAGRFWSRERREALVRRAGLASVPPLGAGLFDRKGIENLMGASQLGSVLVEGAYLRWDTGDWLGARAKVVRRGWVQPNEDHWARRAIEPNRLRGSTTDGGDRTARIPAAHARSSGHAVGRGSR